MAKRTSTSGKRPQPGASETAPSATTTDAEKAPQGALAVIREWSDALMIAFVLAMFIRIFLVELFKIPTGSMTPTLIGGHVAEVDYDGDGRKDLLYYRDTGPPLLFLNNGERLVGQGPVARPPGAFGQERYDRILVNKLSYWFKQPRRGDIVVFKVPPAIYRPEAPIYIKRCAGEPGDRLTFDGEGHLVANGERVMKPDFYATQRYLLTPPGLADYAAGNPAAAFEDAPDGLTIKSINVPLDQVYVFGDNTHSSLDSRYWGGVPLNHIKGRAFFRYWPPSKMKFLGAS